MSRERAKSSWIRGAGGCEGVVGGVTVHSRRGTTEIEKDFSESEARFGLPQLQSRISTAPYLYMKQRNAEKILRLLERHPTQPASRTWAVCKSCSLRIKGIGAAVELWFT